MEPSLRPASSDDGPAIQTIARASFESSYALSPTQIDTLIEELFAPAALEARIEGEDTLVLVAETGEADDIQGFVDVGYEAEGAIQWLHVDPEARGMGIGTALVDRAQEALDDRGLPLTGRTLERAAEGDSFCAATFDLVQTGTEDLDVGGETFVEHYYGENGEDASPNEPSIEVPETVSVDGETLHVDTTTALAGTRAPFYGLDDGAGDPWGYVCTNCGSTDVAADDLDRLVCSACGNEHRAEDWDAAYL